MVLMGRPTGTARLPGPTSSTSSGPSPRTRSLTWRAPLLWGAPLARDDRPGGDQGTRRSPRRHRGRGHKAPSGGPSRWCAATPPARPDRPNPNRTPGTRRVGADSPRRAVQHHGTRLTPGHPRVRDRRPRCARTTSPGVVALTLHDLDEAPPGGSGRPPTCLGSATRQDPLCGGIVTIMCGTGHLRDPSGQRVAPRPRPAPDQRHRRIPDATARSSTPTYLFIATAWHHPDPGVIRSPGRRRWWRNRLGGRQRTSMTYS
jgi:hypothetical protein